MKRFVMMGIIVLLGCQCVWAQTLEEWFNQNKTQKKYLMEQIAALKVYGGYLKKGYGIAKDGLNLISDIKNGDLDLHKDYFNSLTDVRPVIKKYPKVKDIMVLQDAILKMVRSSKRELLHGNLFTAEEVDYLNRVFDRLLKDCSQTTEELEMVVTSGSLKMTDDERIDRIDAIYTVSIEQYKFARVFISDSNLLVQGRRNAIKGISDSKMLNGIN